jgi:hypothetical protein
MKFPLAIVILVAAAQTAAPRFEAVQPELFSAPGAFVNAWADYDGDGDADLFVGFNGTPNRLYRNDKGTFVDVAADAGVAEARAVRASAWGDFDADGDPDLLVGFTPGTSSLLKLYRNDRGRFADVASAVGLEMMTGAVRQPAWVDYDGDGDADLFVAFRDKANALYRNDRGVFSDVAATLGVADARKTVGAVWFDYEQDGDLDLYVANMDGDANGLFRNDKGRFTDVAATAGVEWGGRTPREPTNGTVRPCVADVNSDGRFDLFTANYGKNGLFLAKADGTFADASREWGINIDGRYDACIIGDINNDGRVDMYVNGTFTGGVQYPDFVFLNAGTKFDDVTPVNVRAINADHGASWADADGDGSIDLSLTGSQPNGTHPLFRNTAPSSKYLNVRIVHRGVVAGAEVRAFAAGTKRMVAIAIADSGSGYNMQNDLPIHLGLGSLARVDLEVTLIRDGRRAVERRTNVSTNQTVVFPRAAAASPR